jgi:hypothetical protein
MSETERDVHWSQNPFDIFVVVAMRPQAEPKRFCLICTIRSGVA